MPVINLIRPILIMLIWILANSHYSFAQNDSLDLYQYSLADLSKLKVISASKILKTINEVPATIRIITAEDIKANGYFTLEESLADLQGFQFRNIQGFNSYVFQRGIPSQNNLILILVNGIQINELNSGGFYGGGQYNLSNVERIEVVYGPASVIYGTNAISGIVNIITKKSSEKESLKINGLLGSFNTHYADASYCYTNPQRDFGIRLSTMIKTTEKANLIGAEGDYNWTEKMENYEDDYSFDATFHFKDFKAGLIFQNKQSSRTTNNPSVETDYRDYGTLWNIRFINAYMSHIYEHSNNLSLTTTIYNRNATVLDNTIASINDTSQVGYYRPNYLIGFESIFDYYVNKRLLLNGGILFEYERLADSFSKTISNSPNENPPVPSKPQMMDNHLTSLFIETQYKPSSFLSLIGGLRLDNSSIYNQVVTPRLGVVFIYKNWITKALYTEAFRAPKPWDYTSGAGNPDLKPEKMKSYELSLHYSQSEHLNFEMSLYKNNLNDGIIKESLEDDNFRWINSSKISTDGIELSLQYSKHKIKTYLNYTYNYSTNEDKELIPEIAIHGINSGITYSANNHLKFNIRANYSGKRKSPITITSTGKDFIEPFVIFHGTVSVFNYSHYDLQFIVKNIFNKKYYHTPNLNQTVERYRQPQRTLMLKIGYTF
ncbi:TonB-dependent receptor [Labilibacter sediminis]|nr:TonB-dependent receptor [Labilibacter sediminis]